LPDYPTELPDTYVITVIRTEMNKEEEVPKGQHRYRNNGLPMATPSYSLLPGGL